MESHTTDWKLGYAEQALRSILTNSKKDYLGKESSDLALGRITAAAQLALEEISK